MTDLPCNVNGETETFGIIGRPVRHSLSPAMHNASFQALGMNRIYVPLPTSSIGDGIAGLKALGFRGASVTIPYKQDVLPFIDVLDPVARRIGAVNTLLVREREAGGEKIVHGFNTDWLGANRDLEEKIRLRGSRVLIAGAGGSARAIGFGLLEAGAGVVICNRTVDTGKKLAEQLDCPFYPLDRIDQVSADILVNATSVGMVPDTDRTPVPRELLSGFAVVMDIVYAPLQTRLLREAAAAGCEVVDGLAMLLYQGAAQFELWTGREAPLEVMREVLAVRLRRDPADAGSLQSSVGRRQFGA
ncbi:MAG: shikimate dehydrogenase [Desulfobulbaceae bacterium]|nr:shikimate dehydrogenase [Desulfobulbaceae bacterium]